MKKLSIIIIALFTISCASYYQLNSLLTEPVDFKTHQNSIAVEEIKFNDAIWLTNNKIYLIYSNDNESYCHEVDVESNRIKKLDENGTKEILLIKENIKTIEEIPDTSSVLKKTGKGLMKGLGVLSHVAGRGAGYNIEEKKYKITLSSLDLSKSTDLEVREYFHSGDKKKHESDYEGLEIKLNNYTIFESKYTIGLFESRGKSNKELKRSWYSSPDQKYVIFGNVLLNLFDHSISKFLKYGDTIDYFFIPDPSWTKVAIIKNYTKENADKIYITRLKIY